MTDNNPYIIIGDAYFSIVFNLFDNRIRDEIETSTIIIRSGI